MSLINEMLKDLEKRKNREQNIVAIPVTQNYESDAPNFKKIILAMLFVTLIVAGLYCVRMFFSSNSQQSQPFQLDKTPTPLQPVKQIDSQWLTAANITGITVQTKENITELTFMLNHAALYEVTTNGMQNQFALIIENSQLQSEIPVTNLLNTPIQSITASQTHGNTRFNMTLNPNATIKYININNETTNPELIVAFEYRAVNNLNDNQSQEGNAVKTPVMQSLVLQKYQLALEELKVGKFQQAISNLSTLLEVDPDYHDARATLAAILLDKGNVPEATKVINEGLNILPGYAPFVELKARLLTHDGKIQQALNLLQTSLPPLQENPDYHALIAALYERTNKDVLAVRTYQRLLALDQHNGSWWFGLAVSYDKLGKSRDATTAYERAMNEGHLNTESLAYLQKRLELLQEANNDKA